MPLIRLDTLEPFQAVNLLSDPGHISGPVVIPNCMAVILKWGTQGGKGAVNVCHARYTGSFPGTVAMADAIRTSIGSSLTSSNLLTFMNTNSSFFAVDLRDLSQANQPVVSGTAAATIGTSTGTAMPDEVAACLTLRTAKSGISNRGRIYIPNLASNALAAGNVIAAACVTALGTFGTAIRTAINNQGVFMVIAQPARNQYVGSTGTVHPARSAQTTDVTQVILRDNHFDSQRRRGLR